MRVRFASVKPKDSPLLLTNPEPVLESPPLVVEHPPVLVNPSPWNELVQTHHEPVALAVVGGDKPGLPPLPPNFNLLGVK